MNKLLRFLDLFSKSSRFSVVTVNDLPPPNPEKVEAVVFSSHEIKLDWQAVFGVSEYRLERRRAGESYKLLAQLEPSEVNYLDTNLAPDTHYTYRIRSFWQHLALAGTEVSARTLEGDERTLQEKFS
jgi:hypothetical protein